MNPHFYDNLLKSSLSDFIPAIKGGATIALASSIYYLLFGGILGMSGLIGSMVKAPQGNSIINVAETTKLKTIVVMGMLCASAAILSYYHKMP